jgi:hypothetical protein
VNTVGAFTAAMLIHKLGAYLRGPAQLLVIPLVASGDILGNAAVAWPLWSALNTNYGYGATYPAGILTLILSAFAIHVFAREIDRQRVGSTA